MEVIDNTPPVNNVSDEELSNGETGQLLDFEEVPAEKVPKKKKKTVKVNKGEQKPNFLTIAWNTVKNTALDIYDRANEE